MNNYLKYLSFVFPLPFLINFLFNIPKFEHIYLKDFIFALFCFIFLFYLGFEINKAFSINSISLSIAYYLMGAFALNFILVLIFEDYFSFKNFLIIYNAFVLFVMTKKTQNLKTPFFLALAFLSVRLLTNNYGSSFEEYQILNTDVTEFWLPMTKVIFDNDLYFAINNNIIPGYSLMINYIFSELSYLLHGDIIFLNSRVIPNIFFYLNLLLFFELKIKPIYKFNLIIIYFYIFINSYWLSYLFINSYMGEVITNYLFSVFLLNTLQNEKVKRRKLFFFLVGFLYFLKPFSSILFLIIPLYYILKNKKNSYVVLSLFGYFINYFYGLLNSDSSSSEQTINPYLSIFIENSEKLFNFYFTNVKLIFLNEIFIDKVLTLFLIIYLFIKLYSFKLSEKSNLMTLTLLINLFLVLYLYSTIWKNIELGSAYRYIFSFINIFFIDFSYALDQSEKNTN